MSSQIYKNQIETAQEILRSFIEGTFCYVMLLAQMQSGKTDIFLLVGAELVRQGYVNKIVVFSGNAETNLRKQHVKEARDIFPKKYRKYLREYHNLSIDEAEEVSDMFKKNEHFEVVCGNFLNKYNNQSTKTIFIWDESHYAQSKKQRPEKFLRENGLNPDGKDNNGNLILSVSATPFSELVDAIKKDQHKKLVAAKPGNGYIGTKTMIEGGQVIPYNVKDITQHLRNNIEILKNNSDIILPNAKHPGAWKNSFTIGNKIQHKKHTKNTK